MNDGLRHRIEKVAREKRATLLRKLQGVGTSAYDFESAKAEVLATCRVVDDLARKAPGAENRAERFLAKIEKAGPIEGSVRRVLEGVSTDEAVAEYDAALGRINGPASAAAATASSHAEVAAIKAGAANDRDEARRAMFEAALSPRNAKIDHPGSPNHR